jgi:hypothetical protein
MIEFFFPQETKFIVIFIIYNIANLQIKKFKDTM